MLNNKKYYLPKVRTILQPSKNDLKIGHDNYTANPVDDPIAVNNISSQEFDYTESTLNNHN